MRLGPSDHHAVPLPWGPLCFGVALRPHRVRRSLRRHGASVVAASDRSARQQCPRWDGPLMGLVYSHYLAAPRSHPARERQGGSAAVLPEREPSPLSTPSRLLSAVTRLAAPVSAPSTRDRRSFVGVPAAVVGWLLGPRLVTDVDSLADHERARAALGRSVAAVRDLHSSQGQVAAHKGSSDA